LSSPFTIPLLSLIEFQITGCYETVNLFLNPAFMATVALEALGKDPARLEFREQLGFHDPLIYAMGLTLRDNIVTNGFGSRLYIESLNQTPALHLLYRYSSSLVIHSQPAPRLAASQLRRVMDYINDEFNHELTLTELATVAGYSPAYFARRFKEATGLAPHQYLIRCRVERARALLSTGGLTIAEVAHRVGFADQSHLNRHFKHLLGVSPSILLQEGKNVHVLNKNVQD
jgi:AraC family transcriptional regulator